MSRLPALTPDQLSPEQKRLHDEIAGPRGGSVGGPFAVWLRIPRIAEAANRMGNSLRLEGKLDRRLFELAILVIARHWSAQYEWFVHETAALNSGLSREVVEALRHRKVPSFARSDEQLVYGVVTELQETRSLRQASFERALAALGPDLLIELVSVIGFYTTAAMMINAFDAPVPGGARPLP
ncbi:MAG: carboxymuconolactone decarboxylase family protein [Candidatus Binataceae bacterium]